LLPLFAASIREASPVSSSTACAPWSAQAVEESVDYDLPQPRVKTRLAAKTFDRVESLQPDFPREVFGVVAVTRVIETEHEKASLVGAGERVEGFRLARLRARQFAFALPSLFLPHPSRKMRQRYRHGARDLVGLPIGR
jgi:hypothetical protein